MKYFGKDIIRVQVVGYICIVLGNLVRLPAALEVRNSGLSENGDEKKDVQAKWARSCWQQRDSEISDRDQTFFQLDILSTNKQATQKQLFRKVAQKYTSR